MTSNSSGIPPAPPPVQTVATPAATVTVSVPAAPVALAILSRGAAVEARVAGPAEGGMTVLSAVIDGEAVEISARLPAALPPGVEVSLRVTQPGEATALRLTAVNGRPPALALADPAVLGGRATPAQTALAAENPAAVTAASTIGVGRPIPALVLQGDVMQDPTGQGRAEALPPGTRLTVRLTQFTLPEVAPRAALPGAVSGVAAPPPSWPSAAPAAAVGPSVAPQAAAVLAAARYAAIGRFGGNPPTPPGMSTNLVSPLGPPPSLTAPSFPLHAAGAMPTVAPGVAGAVSSVPAAAASPPSIGSVDGGSSAAPAAPAALATPTGAPSVPAVPGALSGVVISRSALGQPTVHTPAGFVALDVRAPLPNGTQVSFEILSRMPPEVGAPPPLVGLGPSSPWTTLEALWQSLGQTDPAAAARLAAALPQAGPQLLTNLISAMAAVRGGDARAWLGISDPLDRAAPREESRVAKLTQRLSADLKEASRAANRSEGEWRVYPLPFLAGGAVDRIQMLVRRAPDADDAEDGGGRGGGRKDMRFLLDIVLSRLGEMQIDGLVNAGARNLDLLIRTRHPLPEPMPADLRGLYAGALLAVGYTGSLSLRVTPDFVVPVDPAEDAPGRPGVVV